jgi:alpha-tubulin suppressor-like RCC1 family protein
MGEEFTVVLTTDNTLFSWGRNDYGQLGDGVASSCTFDFIQLTRVDRAFPYYVYTSGVLNNKTITTLKAGGKFCLVLSSGM